MEERKRSAERKEAEAAWNASLLFCAAQAALGAAELKIKKLRNAPEEASEEKAEDILQLIRKAADDIRKAEALMPHKAEEQKRGEAD